MHDQPSPAELVVGVRRFLEETTGAEPSAYTAFLTRVSINALQTVERDLAARAGAEAAERAGLAPLAGGDPDASLESLRRKLCDRIRAGEVDLSTPGLLAHLKSTTIAQAKVDQPRYSGLKTALERTE
ncbi:MAG: DUF6285 domain-containing protein [Pseudomonadota bacterium]